MFASTEVSGRAKAILAQSEFVNSHNNVLTSSFSAVFCAKFVQTWRLSSINSSAKFCILMVIIKTRTGDRALPTTVKKYPCMLQLLVRYSKLLSCDVTKANSRRTYICAL